MEEIITRKSVRFTEMIDKLNNIQSTISNLRKQLRPVIGKEVYLTGQEVIQ